MSATVIRFSDRRRVKSKSSGRELLPPTLLSDLHLLGFNRPAMLRVLAELARRTALPYREQKEGA
jgi:hypothetical protein